MHMNEDARLLTFSYALVTASLLRAGLHKAPATTSTPACRCALWSLVDVSTEPLIDRPWTLSYSDGLSWSISLQAMDKGTSALHYWFSIVDARRAQERVGTSWRTEWHKLDFQADRDLPRCWSCSVRAGSNVHRSSRTPRTFVSS